MKRSSNVTAINTSGEKWISDSQLDYVFSVGVIHHILDPGPLVEAAYESLKPGGYFFAWLYGYEGNELYVRIMQPIRIITTRLPHILVRIVVELLYCVLLFHRIASKVFRLPLHPYLAKVFWPLSPQKRRLVIYDQLNPAYAKYYRRKEAIDLFENKGFENVQIHYRHNYSWSVLGQKPPVKPAAK